MQSKLFLIVILAVIGGGAVAQNLNNTELVYTTHVQGLTTPVAFEFLNATTMLVNEKLSGKVKVIVNGVYAGDALDLPVSTNANPVDEMGLLGIVKDPDFDTNNHVYLFYSRATVDGGPWLDDRLVRYTWNGTTLTSPVVLWIMGPTPEFPSPSQYHHGGYLRVGPDEKLYLQRGDMLRFGCMEMNNTPTLVGESGCIYRLELDGSAPLDNPFISNSNPTIKKIWLYGFRNGFGLDWDRTTGDMWFTENGPEVYDEVNIGRSGMNSGWRLIMGPDDRNATYNNNNNTPHNANELFYLSGAFYQDPVFSYLAPIGLAGLSFFGSTRFIESPNTFDNLVMGCTNTGNIYMLPVAPGRQGLTVSGGLSDLVADSPAERDLWSIGTGWGAITDARIGPDGYMYLCSWNTGKIQKVRPKVDAATPFNFLITRGNAVGGNTTSSVEYSDNDRLVVRPGITLSTSQAPILFRVFGTSAHAPTASLKFVVEVSGTSASIQQLVEFFNFTSSTWEVMDQRNLTTSDTTITVSAGGAISRFIQAGTSEVRARVSYRATGPVLGFPWSTRIDMMHWVSELP
jgi:glucose/arabinose dehydrogenase